MANKTNSPWRKERYHIKCCNGCIPPKRYPGCGEKCKEYKEEKAEYLANKKREKEKNDKYPPLSYYDFR